MSVWFWQGNTYITLSCRLYFKSFSFFKFVGTQIGMLRFGIYQRKKVTFSNHPTAQARSLLLKNWAQHHSKSAHWTAMHAPPWLLTATRHKPSLICGRTKQIRLQRSPLRVSRRIDRPLTYVCWIHVSLHQVAVL